MNDFRYAIADFIALGGKQVDGIRLPVGCQLLPLCLGNAAVQLLAQVIGVVLQETVFLQRQQS